VKEDDVVDTRTMPGVVDRHVHLGLVDAAGFAGSAVVEVHDLGWIPSVAAGWQRTGLGGVRVRIAGAFLGPPGGYPSGRAWAPGGAVQGVPDVPAARAAIDAAVQSGWDRVKVTLHAGFPPFGDGVLEALVGAAHGAGVEVVAHVEGPDQVRIAAAAGVDVLAHVPWTERIDDGLVERLAERCTWISTLAIHAGSHRRTAIENAARFVAAGGRLRYGTDIGNGDGAAGVRAAEVLALGAAGLSGGALVEALTGHAGGPVPLDRAVVGTHPVPADAAGLAAWYSTARPAIVAP
jgi:hypothetical protein